MVNFDTYTAHVNEYMENEHSPLDKIVNFIWFALSISSRVLCLAVFAARLRLWFMAIIVSQMTVVITLLLWAEGTTCQSSWRENFSNFISACCYAFIMNFTYIFVLCDSYKKLSLLTYKVYTSYWIITFVQNLVMVVLWYIDSMGEDLWYHDVILVYTISAYVCAYVFRIIYTQCKHALLADTDPSPYPMTGFRGYKEESSRYFADIIQATDVWAGYWGIRLTYFLLC